MNTDKQQWFSKAGAMSRWLLLTAVFISVPPWLRAQDIRKISVPLPVNLERADLHVWRTDYQPAAVVVLCPGFNGNGGDLLRDEQWRAFAREHRLGLAGLSFASNPELFRLGRGYYYASQGSGDALLACVQKAYGKKLPLLLYGFSGGAHFTARFAEWQPARVTAWCAYSAAWWDEPQPDNHAAPGIVACGADDERYQTSLEYYQRGRRLGNRWAWVALPRTGHQPSAALERFAREYFAAILQQKTAADGVWLDRRGQIADDGRRARDPQWSWLPAADLSAAWRALQE
jgi:pimeloyl-ACP methyl ester carboxylesterase